MNYVNPQYLTSTQQLADLIAEDSGQLRIFDVSVSLVPKATTYVAISGKDDYLKSHIAGAAFIDLMQDFSDTSSAFGFTLPSAQNLESAYRIAGIGENDKVVIYSSSHMMWATRFWWMLYSCGHKNVSVLDGGFAKWQVEERAISTEPRSYDPGDFSVQFNRERWADKDTVLAAIDQESICTINALSPDVYSGDAEMSYGRKGHIKNSKNVFYGDLLEAGCFHSADELQDLFRDRGVLDKPGVISYCGGGISATIDALGLALIGYEAVAVYDGSMREWASDENLPMMRGSNYD